MTSPLLTREQVTVDELNVRNDPGLALTVGHHVALWSGRRGDEHADRGGVFGQDPPRRPEWPV